MSQIPLPTYNVFFSGSVYHETLVPLRDAGFRVRRDRVRDAAQEVWIEVLVSLPGYRCEAKLSTWITAIARRTINRWMAGEWQSDFRTIDRDCREISRAEEFRQLRKTANRLETWLNAETVFSRTCMR